jgi:hypothetical protein
LGRLEDAGYVQAEKTATLTAAALTHDGRAALDRYTAVLRQLLDTAGSADPDTTRSDTTAHR